MRLNLKPANFAACLCIAIGCAAGEADAYLMNMKQLMKGWRSAPELQHFVRGYVYATYDSLSTEDNVCVPVGTSIDKVVRDVLDYAERSYNEKAKFFALDDDDKRFPAHLEIVVAFKKLYPCVTQKK